MENKNRVMGNCTVLNKKIKWVRLETRQNREREILTQAGCDIRYSSGSFPPAGSRTFQFWKHKRPDVQKNPEKLNLDV